MVLDLRLGRGGAVRFGEQALAEDARRDELLGRGGELREDADGLDLFGELLGARGGVVGPEEEFGGAGDAVRVGAGVKVGLEIFLGRGMAVFFEVGGNALCDFGSGATVVAGTNFYIGD